MNRNAATLSPAMLSKRLHPERLVPMHVRCMSDVIRTEVIRGQREQEGAIVIVEMPPGHIKSDTCSVHSPLWFLQNWPHKNVALACYGHEKASEFGRTGKNLITDHPEQFDPDELEPTEVAPLRLATDSKAAYRWNTPQGGGMLCTGIGGSLTGFRAHFMIVDDPVKDDKEAQSETYRDSTWEWFRKVAFTRCWPEAVILVVMTRWHEDDLVGRILELAQTAKDKDLASKRVRVVRFPCIAEEDEEFKEDGEVLFQRSKGEALWPAGGYTIEWAAKTKTQVGSRAWASMYQQRPSPAGGAIFQRKHFRYYTVKDGVYTFHEPDGSTASVPDVRLNVRVTVDTALTDKTTSDYTVAMTLGNDNRNRVLVLDVARDQLEVPDQWDYIRRVTARAESRPGYLWTGCEDKGSGIGLLQLAQRRGVPMKELEADTDKVRRATQAAVWMENGMIYFPKDAPWLDALEAELLAFPNGAHDDQVDALSYGVRSIHQGERRPLGAPASRNSLGHEADRSEGSPLETYGPNSGGRFQW